MQVKEINNRFIKVAIEEVEVEKEIFHPGFSLNGEDEKDQFASNR